jgi:membrane protease YdiL (CAAX protease family)
MPDASFPDVAMTPAAAAVDAAIALGVVALFTTIPPTLRGVGWAPRPEAWYVWAAIGGVVVLAAVALQLRWRGQSPSAIGLGRAPAARILGATLVGIPLCYLGGIVAVAVVAGFAPEGLSGLAREKSEFLHRVATIPPALVLPVSLFVGLYEEVLFRGFLLTRFRALLGGTLGAVVLTAALFGALHMTQGLAGMAQTGAVGLVLAVLAARTRSLWSPILTHAVIDTVSLFASGLLVDRAAG